ncbi:type II secretion system F family protein [Candidatus Aenigmatarchaeota archaeon]
MNERKVLVISAIIFAILLVSAFIFMDNLAISTNLLIAGVMVLIFPYYIFKFFQYKRLKAYEKHFPNFLRDLAESQRAGLTILQAIKNSAKSDYGSLTDEVRKLHHQVSWNIPLDKAISNIMNRMKGSRTIRRAFMIISQAQRSGGNIENTMDALANNIENIREVQEEKATLLNQQVIMMYAIFFIFLGISMALIKFMIPLLQTQVETQSSAFGIGDFQANPCLPCLETQNFACIGCNVFFGVSNAFDFGSVDDPAAYYRSLFFTMVIVQGFFSGLIAGQIGSDSVLAGVRHSLIMLVVGFFSFIITTRIGII